MDDAAARLDTGEVTAAAGWRIGRASLGFILDVIALSRGPSDIMDPLILTVVLEANVAAINQDPELQHRFAAVHAPPPDAIRRPVSMSAVAASLRLPYETVRRRITRLAEAGACTLTARGVLISAARVSDPAYLAVATARYERLRRFYFDVAALGALPDSPPEGGPPIPEPPVRLANRVISEYMLRVMDQMMRRTGSPLTGLVLLEMARANAEHLAPDSKEIEGPLPDAARQPVRTLTLAKRLGLPRETVRRHVARLDAQGFCRSAQGGRLAALEQLSMPHARGHGLGDNLTNLQRMFAKLAALGVIAYWEAQAEAARAAI
jgi:DNA-binding Lrp family transcriptional regulator